MYKRILLFFNLILNFLKRRRKNLTCEANFQPEVQWSLDPAARSVEMESGGAVGTGVLGVSFRDG